MHAGMPDPPPDQAHPPDQAPTPIPGRPPGTRPPGPGRPPRPGRHPLPPRPGRHPLPGKQTPAYSLQVSGTHPTGMHSCLQYFFKVTYHLIFCGPRFT